MSTITEIVMNYHSELRNALFISGFTIGSFLFSMKSFILKAMKDEFYDTPEYQNKINKRSKHGKKEQIYKPLKNFSKLLLWSISLSFISALSQISLGHIPNPIPVIISLLLAFASWIAVGISIYFVGENWSRIIDLAEEKASAKISQTVSNS